MITNFVIWIPIQPRRSSVQICFCCPFLIENLIAKSLSGTNFVHVSSQTNRQTDGDDRRFGAAEQEPANPYASPEPIAAETPAAHSADAPPTRPRRWPIVVSAAIFSAMHFGHGFDFVALFFLALGLGYVYRQTHRVLPCIVIHLLLNAGSLIMLWLSVTYGAGT
jgi:hypothetical protein